MKSLETPRLASLTLVAMSVSLGCQGSGGDGASPTESSTTTDSERESDSSLQADCAAEAFLWGLGLDRLIVGGQMEDASFEAARPDVRYHYATGGVPVDGAPGSCDDDYAVTEEGSWYGCWNQSASAPPGQWVRDFMTQTSAAGAVPLFSYYQWYFVSGYLEGEAELAAMTDTALLRPYFEDFRFLVQNMGKAAVPAILHIEPDLWGFARAEFASAEEIPVPLSILAIPECVGLPDDLGGFGRCLLALARREAPLVRVGFHFTGWTALSNDWDGFDLLGDADATVAFMTEVGAAEADLIVVEMSNCDAAQASGWWYDETNKAIPHFAQALAWSGRLSDSLGLGHLWWQIPYGHMGLDDTPGRYRDNRLDYFFDHTDEFASAQGVGMVFGSGCGNPTMPETDDGHFIERVMAYAASGGEPACGTQR